MKAIDDITYGKCPVHTGSQKDPVNPKPVFVLSNPSTGSSKEPMFMSAETAGSLCSTPSATVHWNK